MIHISSVFFLTSPSVLPPLKSGFCPYVSTKTPQSCCQLLKTVLSPVLSAGSDTVGYIVPFEALAFLGFVVALQSPSLLPIGILSPLYLFFIKFLKQYLLLHVFLKYWYYLDFYIYPLLVLCKTVSLGDHISSNSSTKY